MLHPESSTSTFQSPQARRACLTVPGSNERMLAKAAGLDVDMVVVDLEDAVAPAAKAPARAAVADAIRAHDWRCGRLGVRINDWTSPWTVDDLTAIVDRSCDRLRTIVLPKVQGPSMVQALDLVLSQLESNAGFENGRIGIDAQIESAAGVHSARAICSASPRVDAVALGPLDLAASLGMPADPAHGRTRLDPIAVAVVVAGRAAGVQVIDGPYTHTADHDGLRHDAGWAAELGFEGKWAIHPDQIPTLLEAFTPTDDEVERAQRILDAHEGAATVSVNGAILVDGEMVDEASCRAARATIARREDGRRASSEGVR